MLLSLVRNVYFDPACVARIETVGRWDSGAEKPLPATISADGTVSCVGNRGSSIAVSLRQVPTAAQWSEEECPYPVDYVNTFFIPSAGIHCVQANGIVVDCVGKFDCRMNSVRIDAVDQEDHSSLWFEFTARMAA